jgi:hypothetical protein
MVGQARRNDFDTVTEMEYRKSAVTLSSAATYTYTTTFIPISKQKKKPWWCSGQHTRPGILSSYPLYLSFLTTLFLEGREVVGSNPTHGAYYSLFDSVLSDSRELVFHVVWISCSSDSFP